MKRLIKKNQVIITVLAVMIAVAGYLNYSGRLLEKEADQMTTGNNTILLTAEEDNTSLAEEGTYVDIISLDGDDSEEVSAGDVLEESADSGVPGEAVLASVSTTDALISQAKLNREANGYSVEILGAKIPLNPDQNAVLLEKNTISSVQSKHSCGLKLSTLEMMNQLARYCQRRLVQWHASSLDVLSRIMMTRNGA